MRFRLKIRGDNIKRVENFKGSSEFNNLRGLGFVVGQFITSWWRCCNWFRFRVAANITV